MHVRALFHPNFEGEHPGGGSRASHPMPPTLREDLQLDGCLEYLPAAKALYIYKHPCLLRDSNPGLTAQQPASQTSTSHGQLDLDYACH
ncbi:hypothetical protein TNCV_853721 [Trichonephila clavipes]|nr:hypothetical protein TNCV_853721 [Trichonephila clavipes]